MHMKFSLSFYPIRYATSRICMILCLFVIISGLYGCKHYQDSRLQSAYAAIDNNPDSVRLILMSINADSLSNDYNRAFHSLCIAIVNDKCRISQPQQSDSTLQRASLIFKDKGDIKSQMLADFYRSVILFQNGDNSGSIPPLMNAIDLMQEIKDDYYLAKAYEHLSDIYVSTYNIEASNKELNKAAKYYTKSGKKLNSIYASISEASGLALADNSLRSLIILDSLSDIVDMKDSTLMQYYNYAYVLPEHYLGRNEKALYHFRKCSSYRRGTLFANDFTMLCSLFLSLGEIDSARYYMNILSSDRSLIRDSLDYLNVLTELRKREMNYKGAIASKDSAQVIYNSRIRNMLLQNEAFAERDHFKAATLLHQEKENHLKRTIIITTICVFLFIIAVVSYIRMLRIRHKSDSENAMKRIKKLGQELHSMSLEKTTLKEKLGQSEKIVSDSKEQESIHLKNELELLRKYEIIKKHYDDICEKYRIEVSLLKTQKETAESDLKAFLNERNEKSRQLTDDYFRLLGDSILPFISSLTKDIEQYDDTDNPKMKKEFMRKFNRSIDRLKQSGMASDICEMVCAIHNDVLTEFSHDFPKLQRNSKITLACLLSGLSNDSIALLLNKDSRYISLIKTRLKNQMESSESRLKHTLLPLFHSRNNNRNTDCPD